jgi:fructose-1,6-bisphosphatase/inositol monophosphatase family enzyme
MKEYIAFGTELALQAGEIMRKYFATSIKKEWKKDNTPVTAADIAVNKLVIESVLKEYPTHGILGEEESFMKESDYIWVCDPIDGTIPFIHGIPTFTFSLALTHSGMPVVAVVYDPLLKRMFTSEKGKGAFLNGEKINVAHIFGFDRQTVGIEGKKIMAFNHEIFREELLNKGVRFTILNSLTYTSVLVAMGEFIASVYAKVHPWDCAAVKLIIDEAGGKTTDIYGNEQRYDKSVKGFVASNGLVHDELIELIKRSVGQKI